MLKINYNKIGIILTLTITMIITTSCSNNKLIMDNPSNNKTQESAPNDYNDSIDANDITNKDNISNIKDEATLKNNNDETITNINQNTEVNAIEYFESEALAINKDHTKETFIKIKDKGIEVLKNGVDFVFNGKEINGVTFNELTEEGKERVVNALVIIDNKIMEYSPEYKEQIGSTYQKLKDITNNTIDKGKDKIKESIGDDTYDNIIDESKKIIEKDKQFIKDLWNKGKNWFNKKE